MSSILGASVGALPELRPDLSFVDWISLPNFTGAFGVFHTVDSRYWEKVVAVSFSLTTTAAAGNRTPTLEIRNADSTVVMSVPANQLQAPGTGQNYLFSSEVAAPWQPSLTFSVTPFPSIALGPGWRLFFDTAGGNAGDLYASLSVGVLKVPSGPKLPGEQPLTPTPLIA